MSNHYLSWQARAYVRWSTCAAEPHPHRATPELDRSSVHALHHLQHAESARAGRAFSYLQTSGLCSVGVISTCSGSRRACSAGSTGRGSDRSSSFGPSPKIAAASTRKCTRGLRPTSRMRSRQVIRSHEVSGHGHESTDCCGSFGRSRMIRAYLRSQSGSLSYPYCKTRSP